MPLAADWVDWSGSPPGPIPQLRLGSLRRWSERGIIALVMQTVDNSLTLSLRRRFGGVMTSAQGHARPIRATCPARTVRRRRSPHECRARVACLEGKLDLGRLKEHLIIPGAQRIFWIYHALKAGHSVEEIHRLTEDHARFLREIEEIVVLEGRLRSFPVDRLPEELLEKAKRGGFADNQIAVFCSGTEAEAAARRESLGLRPAYKRVDTCAGEFSNT